ncbi:phage protein NinX family protein [Enterobacter asburiae]|uniref:phage protein NinX family protein n=1 Tax=Enterobacter asburiae TaxID=61645 RepID=UPI000BB8BC86|nr:phage protein NinX family protein [Enterobacter asburiae]
MDYSQLSDQEINMLVAKIQHPDKNFIESKTRPPSVVLLNHINNWVDYCNNWSDGGPIIVSNQISLMYEEAIGKWCAGKPYWVDGCEWQLDIDVMEANPLRSAMIFFLIMQDANHV